MGLSGPDGQPCGQRRQADLSALLQEHRGRVPKTPAPCCLGKALCCGASRGQPALPARGSKRPAVRACRRAIPSRRTSGAGPEASPVRPRCHSGLRPLRGLYSPAEGQGGQAACQRWEGEVGAQITSSSLTASTAGSAQAQQACVQVQPETRACWAGLLCSITGSVSLWVELRWRRRLRAQSEELEGAAPPRSAAPGERARGNRGRQTRAPTHLRVAALAQSGSRPLAPSCWPG